MKKGVTIVIIVLVIFIIIRLAYYSLIVKNSNKKSGTDTGGTGTGIAPTYPTFSVGDNVYLDNSAPPPSSYYDAIDTIVYTYPSELGSSVNGKLHRDWYTGQSIGTFVGEVGNYYQVNVRTDLKVYKYDGSSAYGTTPTALLGNPNAAHNPVFFRKGFLSKVQYS